MIPAALALSMAAVAGVVLAADNPGELESVDGTRRVLSVTGTGALLMLLVGIVMSAGEQRHGTASDTYLTTPRRHRVVTAKVVVGAGVGLATGIVTSAASLGLGGLLYQLEDATFRFGESEVWTIVAGTLGYTTLFAVLGVGLGALIRNQVLAVAVALAWFAVVEHTLVGLVPDIGRWLPAAAGQAMVRTPVGDLLSPLVGGVVVAAYIAVITLAGFRAVATRDV